jgi:hypothetical protein
LTVEGSQAGAQGGGEAQGGEQQAAQQGPDIGQLAEQLNGVTQGQQELVEFLKTQPWQQQAQAEPAQQEEQGLDLSFLDETDPAVVADQLQKVIQQGIQDGIQKQVNPQLEKLQGDFAEDRRVREMEVLVGEFPELSQDDVAKDVVGLARQMADALGQPGLADEPKFWRYAYMVGRAAEAANKEGAESPQAVTLEGGGGAAPAGSSGGSPIDAIFSPQSGGRNALPF